MDQKSEVSSQAADRWSSTAERLTKAIEELTQVLQRLEATMNPNASPLSIPPFDRSTARKRMVRIK